MNDKHLSAILSSDLERLGVTLQTVKAKQKSGLLNESWMIINQFLMEPHDPATVCIFGSQSEGTATPGYNSDFDILYAKQLPDIFNKLEDWQIGRTLRMFRKPTTPPRHYYLQAFRFEEPQPVKEFEELEPEERHLYMRLKSGEIVLRSDNILISRMDVFGLLLQGNFEIHGPAIAIENHVKILNPHGPEMAAHLSEHEPFEQPMDNVIVYQVRDKMTEIEQFTSRPRPGHWPSQGMLDAAGVCYNFLVASGSSSSDEKCVEWRLSTNLIERILMLSLNQTQIKCNVVLKMINKSLFHHVTNSFSSFHCKTMLFFTIEQIEPQLWQENNLWLLVQLCLKTLMRWLKARFCPHFIIRDVNLFDGKLSCVNCKRLHRYVADMLTNNMRDIAFLHKDDRHIRSQNFLNFGKLMSANTKFFVTAMKEYITPRICINILIDKASVVFKFCKLGNVMQRIIARCMAKHMLFDIAHTSASMCIQAGIQISNQILACYRYSLSTDVASSRLKMASMLLSAGHIGAVIYVLEFVERTYNDTVQTLCQSFENINAECYNQTVMTSENTALCVTFWKEEAYCLPPVLVLQLWVALQEGWHNAREFDLILERLRAIQAVDARSLLYYLQYLTYGSLRSREQQVEALSKFVNFVLNPPYNIHHKHMTYILLGHCWEMEGDVEIAEMAYRESAALSHERNSALEHIRRIEELRNA
ncbi:hypothetical protein DPMN_068781 [Dreissena polymorpha]|uniref:Mab-21-like HhH/H2TH-like domain-containing protein n=2 Tax=Dreissena polymorpha TaxID=45954 RepID=A0A9D3Z329_DREPO|nr:hypothetical protein DPMN_068781 [Dreissena polymorpha]